MDEIVNEIKQIYLDWYNSDIDDYVNTAKALFMIGELVKDVK